MEKVFSLVFLLIPLHFLGSNPDSLWSVWLSPESSAQIRLEAIDRLISENFLHQDPDSALGLLELQIAFARQRGDQYWEMRGLMSKGIACYLGNRYDQAGDALKNSLQLSEAINDGEHRPDIYRMMGVVLEAQGSPQESLQYYTRSLELSRAMGDSSRMTRALNSLGIANENYLGNYQQAIRYYQQAIQINRKLDRKVGLSNNLYNMASTYYKLGNYILSLQYNFEALKLFEEIEDSVGIQDSYNSIGNIYDSQQDHDNALVYYQKSLELSILTGDRLGESLVKSNIGNLYVDKSEYRAAIRPLEESAAILEELDNQQYLPHAYYYLGILYWELGNSRLANTYLLKSKELATEINFEIVISKAVLGLSEIALLSGNLENALDYLFQARELGRKLGNKEILSKVYEGLAKIYARQGQTVKELTNYRLYIAYRDSLLNEETIRETTRQELMYNFAKQQLADSLDFAHQQVLKDLQIEKERNRWSAAMFGVVMLLIVSGVIFTQYRSTRKARKRSDELLLNILPSQTAEELKSKGYTTARAFEKVTILFTDFQDFTKVAVQMTARELVEEIDHYFRVFDQLTEKYGLEKIKTNGDSYIAVGGLPEDNQAGALEVIKTAIEMQQFIKEVKAERIKELKPYFDMRVGIHSGSVVAGVVGIKKFQYDIWGDTVNTAARLETNGQAGKINISQSTYDQVKREPSLKFERRGKIAAKNKGELEMYFVEPAE